MVANAPFLKISHLRVKESDTDEPGDRKRVLLRPAVDRGRVVSVIQHSAVSMTRLAVEESRVGSRSSFIGNEHLEPPHFVREHLGRVQSKLDWLSQNEANPWTVTIKLLAGGCDGFAADETDDNDAVYDFKYVANSAGVSVAALPAWFSIGLLAPQVAHLEAHSAGFVSRDLERGESESSVLEAWGGESIEDLGYVFRRDLTDKYVCGDTTRVLASKLLWETLEVSSRPRSRLLQIVRKDMSSWTFVVTRALIGTDRARRLPEKWQRREGFVQEILEKENDTIVRRNTTVRDWLPLAMAVALTLLLSVSVALHLGSRLRSLIEELEQTEHWRLVILQSLSRRAATNKPEEESEDQSYALNAPSEALCVGFEGSARWLLTANIVHYPVEGIFLRWNENCSPFFRQAGIQFSESKQTSPVETETLKETSVNLCVKIIVRTNLDPIPKEYYTNVSSSLIRKVSINAVHHLCLLLPFEFMTAFILSNASTYEGLRYSCQCLLLGEHNKVLDISNVSQEEVIPPSETTSRLPLSGLAILSGAMSYRTKIHRLVSSFPRFIRKHLVKSHSVAVKIRLTNPTLLSLRPQKTGCFCLVLFLTTDSDVALKLSLFAKAKVWKVSIVTLGNVGDTVSHNQSHNNQLTTQYSIYGIVVSQAHTRTLIQNPSTTFTPQAIFDRLFLFLAGRRSGARSGSTVVGCRLCRCL
eukprot:Gregarina_sp_Poly_1__715@NODE_116_length_13672_cov_23_062992_g103_i0_p2_GENE_NODE_116_length_13672_cov_23_062992_g103_i0NODE_116_length_13672_cov_23_062992_g103_i0_p2_ORF_typecomplete_len698_score112_28Prion_bPrPp/PF11587_8/0_015_NODE_116_length_13672_cov_23_062992_g103_i016443737